MAHRGNELRHCDAKIPSEWISRSAVAYALILSSIVPIDRYSRGDGAVWYNFFSIALDICISSSSEDTESLILSRRIPNL